MLLFKLFLSRTADIKTQGCFIQAEKGSSRSEKHSSYFLPTNGLPTIYIKAGQSMKRVLIPLVALEHLAGVTYWTRLCACTATENHRVSFQLPYNDTALEGVKVGYNKEKLAYEPEQFSYMGFSITVN